MSLIFVTIAALLPIINPFSTAPLFLAITQGYPEAERISQARRGIGYMIAILGCFLLGGSFIMNFFGLSLPGLRIAGGILVAGVGARMLNPRDDHGQTPEEKVESQKKKDISFTPLAMPSLSGPGAISVTIGLTSMASGWLDYVWIFAGILGVAAIAYVVLRLSTRLVRFLGVNGLHAMTKIMGFLILCVGIQFIVNGVQGIATTPEFLHAIRDALNTGAPE
ncbi:MAG: MarC family NAAT transporter [Opitutaceae bacterium]|jgi:multiple antibiotic resistance protein|nr:MarC family NAAT transporter [Opitutaceae bacterium]